jgi:hypothetical protein
MTTTKATRTSTGAYDITLLATGNRIATIEPDLYGGGQFGTGRSHQEGWAVLNIHGKRIAKRATLTEAKALIEAAATKRYAQEG